MSIKKLCIFILAVVLSACSTVNNKVGEALNLDTDLKLQLVASRGINPDEQGKTSPVFIRLYELSNTKNFDKADFIDIYERDEEVLADTLIAKQELKRVVPGAERTEEFVLSKDTRYVALFAEFYRYKDAKAKVVFPITSSNVVRNTVKVRVTSNDLVIVED